MSEVKRFLPQKTPIGTVMKESPEGYWIQAADFDAQRLRADTAEAALKIAGEDAALMLKDLDAAEQRIAEMEKDAARYQWLRDKSQNHHQFYLSTPLYFTGVKFSKKNVDRTIDAALNPNPEAESHACKSCFGTGHAHSDGMPISGTCDYCKGTGHDQ